MGAVPAAALNKEGDVELATLENIDLLVLEKVCQLFFDQMGFVTKVASPSSAPGVSGLAVLFSKANGKPFSLCQCAVGQARIDLDLLGRFQTAMRQQNLASGYFITCGSPDFSIREFVAANKINLIDGLKFTELINKLPENSRNLLTETISSAQTLKEFDETGRFRSLADSSGSYQQVADETGRHRVSEIGAPPLCFKCGERMKLQVSLGKYKTGRYWQCPNPDCGHINAVV